MNLFAALLFLASAPALAGGHALSFTFSAGAFRGEKVEAGKPVLVRRFNARTRKFSEPAWGTLVDVAGAESNRPVFEVKSPVSGRTSRFSQAEITPEAEEGLPFGAAGEKITRGSRVTMPPKAGELEVVALFAPDLALVRAEGPARLAHLPQLALAGPPPSPKLPDFRIEAFYQFVASEFQIQPAGSTGNANTLTFRPAESHYLGVGAGYKGIGASYSFSIPASSDVRATEGTSQYRDLRLNYYSRTFAVELAYSKYTGYLIDNSNVLSAATLNGQKFYKLPDMTAEGYGANVFYVFSPEVYSLPAGNDHSEIETENAGSLIALASFRRQAVHNDTAIIPAEKQALFGDEGTITGFRTFSYAAGPGYGYHWLPRWKVLGDSFFVAPLLALSLGYETISEDLDGFRRDSAVFGLNVHMRLGFGWNSPRFFALITTLVDAFTGQTGNVQFDGTQSTSTLTVGTRF